MARTRRREFRGRRIGDLVEIELTQGFVTVIDVADEAIAAQHRWYTHLKHGKPYAIANVYDPIARRNKTTTKLHRLLTEAPPGLEVDHVNGDPLDNRRANLRLCSHRENLRNQRRGRIKGVCFNRNRWIASICKDGERWFLGSFVSREDAMRAYDKAAVELFGDFAAPNPDWAYATNAAGDLGTRADGPACLPPGLPTPFGEEPDHSRIA